MDSKCNSWVKFSPYCLWPFVKRLHCDGRLHAEVAAIPPGRTRVVGAV